MTEEQYQDLLARLERIEAKQVKERWGWHFAVMLGTGCVVAILSPQAALLLMAAYFFIKAYRWTIESIPPESHELILMQVGEDGEPDRPTPISSFGVKADPGEGHGGDGPGGEGQPDDEQASR